MKTLQYLKTHIVSSLLMLLSLSFTLAEVQAAANVKANDDVNDYMVVVNRPNNMHFVDLTTDKIIRTCKLPSELLIGTVVMSKDRKTAFVLAGRFDRIFGVKINSCELIFDAQLSYDNVRVKSIGSLAVSHDGKEVYTIHNPTRILNDHYEVMDTKFAVYRVADGIGAKPAKTYPIHRQINIMSAADDGLVYLSGGDVYSIDPTNGKVETVIASLNGHRKGYGTPDVLTIWPLGQMNNDFIRMYTVPKYADETNNPATATYMWGYERVDLSTGKTEVKDFGPVEQVFFTGMLRPNHPDGFYAVLTQLRHYKVSEQRAVKSIDLERTYYCINFSTDGSKLYLGGTYNDIAVYDAETLTKLNNIVLPGGDMSLGTFQVFSLPKSEVIY